MTKATRREIADELAKKLADQQKGIPIDSEKQTVAKFLEHWLDQVVKPTVRPKTHRTYSDLCKHHITPALVEVPLGKLSPQNVREFLNAKLVNGLSARTVKHLLVTLRGALAVAIRDGQIPRNVAALVDPPRCQRAETAAFSPDEARAFLDAVCGQRYEAAFTAAVAVGLREGEVLGLRWEDIDLETGRLTVSGALQRVNQEAGAGRTEVRIKPPHDAITRRVYGCFRAPEIGPGRDAEVGRIEVAGNRLRVHHPKLARGVSPRYITDLLGHSQVSFTHQTYAHVLPEVQKPVATKPASGLPS